MDKIEKEIFTQLTMKGISIETKIDYMVNNKPYSLTYQFIIESYMKAGEESKLVFLRAFQKAQKAGQMGIEKFFEGMGQLLLMGSLSQKFP